MHRWVWAGFIAILTVSTGPALAVVGGQVDDFQAGTIAGWSGAAPSNIATGGPAGVSDRYLQLESGLSPNLAAFNFSQWSGDYLAEGIADLGIDFRNPNASPLSMRAVILGPGGSRWTSATPAIVPPDSAWHHYTFSLREADVLNVLAGDTYAQTISAVARLLIRHEVTPSSGGTGFTGQVGIDNITAVVPEPSALGLLTAAGALLIRRRR